MKINKKLNTKKLFEAALGRERTLIEKRLGHVGTPDIDSVRTSPTYFEVDSLKPRQFNYSYTVLKNMNAKGIRVYRSKKTGYYHVYLKTSPCSTIFVINSEIFEKSNIRLKKGGRCKLKEFALLRDFI